MRRNAIKFEELSSDIKKEIEKFHNRQKEFGELCTMEEAMAQWFEEEFDIWMVMNFSSKLKGERRAAERRKHMRLEVEEEEKEKEKKDRRAAPRRKKFRLDIEVPVKIVETLIESSSEERDAIDFIGTLVNISRGGFYFRSAKAFEPSSIIRVCIDLSRLDIELRDIEALAMVIRSEKISAQYWGVGVMFSSIYHDAKEKLDTLIFKHLAYYVYS
jgi:hypothetical protein